MKKLLNLFQYGFIAKVIFLILFTLIFKEVSFGQSCTNLVVNGDFSSGNTAFTNDFTFFAPGSATAVGKYSVLNSTQTPIANPQWACTGHTTASATDQFLMCDGAAQAGKIAWKQTIDGNGQGCYKFCFWVNNLVIPTKDYSDPYIQVKINGVIVGATVTIPEIPDTWVEVCATWTGTLPANLEILTLQLGSIGNDFAIDDISFSKCCELALNIQATTSCASNYNVSATACGTGLLTYQWCDGSTNASYNTTVPCGDHTFCVTMTDAAGCKASASQTINAKDNIPPVAKCKPGLGVFLNANCQYVVDPAFVNNGSTDNCEIQSISVSPTLLTGCGNTTVTLTVKDLCNNTSTCTMGIQTIETTPPTITCPANKTINCDDSILPPNTGNPVSQDACGIKSTKYTDEIKQNPCGYSIFRTWTVEDNCGNTSACTQIITLIDTKPPTINNCPLDQTVSTTIGKCEYDLTTIWNLGIIDNCDANPTITLLYNGILVPVPPTSLPKGVNTFVFTVTDKCGNTTTCSFKITVVDTEKPKIICPKDITINGTIDAQGNCKANMMITAELITDNCPMVSYAYNITGATTASGIGPATVMFMAGISTVTLTATDMSGNITICTFLVTVNCDNCKCGTFSSTYYQFGPNTPKIPKNCGDTLAIDCKPTFNPIFGGIFACVGTCPDLPINWQLISPTGIITTGTVSGPSFSISILGASLSTTGIYQLTLTGQCGTTACPPCKFFIKVNCNDCECGTFSDILYRPSQGAPSVSKVCGDTLVAPCKPAFNPIITGTFTCLGNCPNAPISWQLISPTGIITTGTVSGPSFSVSILGASLATTGIYQLTLTGQCGTTACPPCKFFIKVNCNDCECGTFSNILYRPSQGAPSVSKVCGDTLVAPCKPAFNPIITGTFTCLGNCLNAPISWQLISPTGVITTGTVSGPSFSVSILGASLATTGIYQLTLTGQCGTTACPPCKFFIKVNCTDKDCGYIQNSDFNSGIPIGDEGINSATNWSGIWNTSGCSTGDFYPNPAALPWLLTNPLPVTQGNYGSFWVNKTAATTNPVWREGIMNNLNAPIKQKTGCYEVEFKVACLYPAYKIPFLKVYGVNTAGPAPTCPTYSGLNTALFPAGSTVKDLGTYALTSECNNNYQTVKVVFNTSTWITDIDHIFFTRSDDTEGHAYVALDDVCVRNVNCGTCECGTINNAVVYHVANTPVAIACNNATRVKIPCKKVGPNFFIHGDFPCLGNNCGQNNMQWELTRPSGGTLTGTIALWGNHFDITLPWTNFATAGNYSLKVTRFCGDKPCVCVFNFVVEVCPCSCDALKNDVNQGFNVISTIVSCKRTFKPIALCPSDAVTWQISRLTGGTWTTTLSSTGSNSLVVSFPGTGYYNVCMIVSRIDPTTGKQCKYEYCKKIFVKCFGLADVITDSHSASCIDGNIILNGNFTDTSNVAGELGSGGILGHWAIFKNQGSDGTVMVEDSIGAFDSGSATIIGRKNNYAGIVQKLDLPKKKYAHVRYEYYNWQNGNTPTGTTIDIFLMPNATNDLGGQHLHRVNVTNDTTSGWKQVSFTVGGNVNFDNKHFVCCVQNGEADKIFSVISVDNFEVCSVETTDSKEETLERIGFKVFPNPNTGDFNVELPFDANEKMKLRITDLTGRILVEKQPTVGTTSQRIELNDLANGLYFIQVVQEGRVIGVERFVKQ